MSLLLEICIDSVASARAARAGGADRLEVCSALTAAGTTPSLGLIRQCVREVGLPVMMMIRPHDGPFVYDADDRASMLTDIRAAHDEKATGVVFGALTEQGQVDQETCRELLDASRGLDTTFHRAFDCVSDPQEALEVLIELGFRRVLTSGLAPTALAGADLLRSLRAQADDRIEILPGSGVTPETAGEIVARTGTRTLHGSAAVASDDPIAPLFPHRQRLTQAGVVRDIRQAAEVAMRCD